MVRSVSEDEQFAAEFQRQVNRRALVKRLFAIRSARGISQHSLARHIGFSPRRIAKLQGGTDADVTIAELVRYLHATRVDWHVAGTTPRATPL